MDRLLTNERLIYPEDDEQRLNEPIKPGGKQRIKRKFDVVIPTAKLHLKWLPTTIKSILNQCWADPLIHVVFDGYSHQKVIIHEKVKYYYTKRRFGPYRIVNMLFDHLESDFIVIQDSDDISTPNRLYRSGNILSNLDYDIFGGAMEQFVDYESEDMEYMERMLYNAPYVASGHKWQTAPCGTIVHGTMTVKKKVFEELNGYADYLCTGDFEFITRAFAAKYKIYVTDQIVGLRRLHRSSLSRSEKTGLNSDFRAKLHADMIRRFKEFRKSGEYWTYGSLDIYRSSDDLIKISAPRPNTND